MLETLDYTIRIGSIPTFLYQLTDHSLTNLSHGTVAHHILDNCCLLVLSKAAFCGRNQLLVVVYWLLV